MPVRNWKGQGRVCGHGKGRGQGRGRGSCEFRMTSAREDILSVLQKNAKHMTAEDIFMLAKRINPQIGLATVYRTLELLTDTGLIKKLDFGKGTSNYEYIDEEKRNAGQYLVCQGCGKIIHYSPSETNENTCLETIAQKIKNSHGFIIDKNHIQFHGYCKDCC